MSAIIQTKNVSFSYQGEEAQMPLALENVTIAINKGEMVAILGHNGCGKSTLAKHFNAVLLPVGGTVYVDGIDTNISDKLFDIRGRVGMVFQNPDNQIVATIVEEDVAFGLENMGIPPLEIRKRVDEALKIVGMYEYREHAPHQLSGGQKQRIAIAGVIAMRPSVIVLDEPTAMLDPRGRKEVIDTIRALNRKYSITVILITHYMDEAVKCDRVVVMEAGSIRLDATPKEVFSQVEYLKQIRLDVPQVTELVYELRQMGYDLPSDVITEQECVDLLEKLITKT